MTGTCGAALHYSGEWRFLDCEKRLPFVCYSPSPRGEGSSSTRAASTEADMVQSSESDTEQEPSESLTTPPENDTGTNFLVVFPENIADFHPSEPENMILFTALLPDTNITIKLPTGTTETKRPRVGWSDYVTLDQRSELKHVETSGIISQITSNKRIITQAISHRANSMQSAVIVPTDNLRTTYSIPPAPPISKGTDNANQVLTTERSPFGLAIVNGDHKNTVTLEGTKTKVVMLKPNQVTSLWLETGSDFRMVKADKPVAVLFGHPCAIQENCSCGLLYTVLPPPKDEMVKFLIPPELAKGVEAKTFILLSESHKKEPFNINSPVVEASGIAILFRPGLLIPLIPEANFGACYVVTSIPEANNSAVIVVHKDLTAQVNVNGSGSTLISGWKPLNGTDYVSTSIDLPPGNTILWHSSATMAIYYLGSRSGTFFGNPAPIISTTPDYRGCLVIPEVIAIRDPTNWRTSMKVCKESKMELISFSESQEVTEISKKIISDNRHPQHVWIGMRRSSLSGEWYWANGNPITETNWDEGEPGTMEDGHCAIMNLKSSNSGWHDESCCKDFHPLCYKDPVLLPLEDSVQDRHLVLLPTEDTQPVQQTDLPVGSMK
ncbi:uncharacterized protein KZ484_026792 [Pholidichthys leucotaenia]